MTRTIEDTIRVPGHRSFEEVIPWLTICKSCDIDQIKAFFCISHHSIAIDWVHILFLIDGIHLRRIFKWIDRLVGRERHTGGILRLYSGGMTERREGSTDDTFREPFIGN